MLKGTYLITGITGYIGSLLAKELMSLDAYASGDIQIVGLVRDKQKADLVFEGCDCSHVKFVQGDLMEVGDLEASMMSQDDGRIDFIIHCAATTTSAYMVSNPVETADGIVMGTRNVLELAGKMQVKSMVFLSSMEVYGQVADIGHLRREEELGEIALEAPRSCYPLGKRMAEHYCHIYEKEYGVPVKIARLAQTFGVGVRPDDNRVYMQFAKAAMAQKDIVLKTRGTSVGNYCAADDAVEAILLLLHSGANGEVYNVVNEANTMCIREMAQLVASEIAENRISVRIEPEDANKTGYAPDTGLRLSGEKLRQLGWMPKKTLVEMYGDVISTLASSDKMM